MEYPKMRFPTSLDAILVILAVGMGWTITYADSHGLEVAEIVCGTVFAIIAIVFIARLVEHATQMLHPKP